MPDSAYAERSTKLRLVHDEVDRQRLALAVRVGNPQTRAAILIGGVGIGLTFLASAKVRNCLTWESAGLAIAAAIAGVVGMVVVGQRGQEVRLREMRDSVMDAEDLYSGEWTLVEDKITAHEAALTAYKWRYWVTWGGFAALALSWIAAAFKAYLTRRGASSLRERLRLNDRSAIRDTLGTC